MRDWIYIDDHISAINFLMKNGKIGESYCIGSNNELSNIDIIKKICKVSDKILNKNSSSFNLVKYDRKIRPGHDLRYSINSKKDKLSWVGIHHLDFE